MTAVNKRTIGRVENIHLPEWGISGLDAKVDTGAYTSSIHCEEIKLLDNDTRVQFFIPFSNQEEATGETELPGKQIAASVAGVRRVKSSNGAVEERISVRTLISIGGEEYKIELTLTDRSDMKYPVLLGRRFLKHRFIVDVSERNLY